MLTVMDAEDLEKPMTGERYDEFHHFVENIITGKTERVARIKVWSKDGTVIYSDEASGVGETFPIQEHLREALAGGVSFEIEVPDGAENERNQFLGTLMEIYSPIIFDGSDEPQGAFEIYQYYQPTATA